MESVQQVAQACTDTYWPGWTAVAVCCSGIVAVIAIMIGRKTAREKNAADLLVGLQRDERLAIGVKLIREKYENNKIDELASAANFMSDESCAVRYTLNSYEDVAIGIKRKIYSEPFVKDSYYSIIIELCDRAGGYMQTVRTRMGQGTAWMELESLGKRWKKKPIPNILHT